MREVMAIIRPQKLAETKQAMIAIGVYGYTCIKAKGRGQKAVLRTLPDGSTLKTNFVNKRIFLVVVEDEKCDETIAEIMRVNCTYSEGDGRIFVSVVEKNKRVRQGGDLI
jgi:nitrogen regulatory protein PII 2